MVILVNHYLPEAENSSISHYLLTILTVMLPHLSLSWPEPLYQTTTAQQNNLLLMNMQ